MSTSTPIPIILCGQSVDMATKVTEALLPEVEAIHVFLTTPSFTQTAPLILSSPTPQTLTETPNIGSQDYSKSILAVVTGSAFGDDDVEKMMASLSEAEKANGKKVVWMRPDLERKRPPFGPEYGKFVVRCVKECLARLEGEGKLSGEGGVFLY